MQWQCQHRPEPSDGDKEFQALSQENVTLFLDADMDVDNLEYRWSLHFAGETL
jgi:hypothetical protein